MCHVSKAHRQLPMDPVSAAAETQGKSCRLGGQERSARWDRCPFFLPHSISPGASKLLDLVSDAL